MRTAAHAMILMIEDHGDTKSFFVTTFEAQGYRVVTTLDVHTALRYAEVVQFDAVVLDLELRGGINSSEISRRLRTLQQRCLIAIGGPDPKPGGHENAFDHFLKKPVVPARLLAIVRECILRDRE